MRAKGILPYTAIWIWGIMMIAGGISSEGSANEYRGKYCDGKGDVEYLRLIDRSFEFFHPNPDRQNISMVYRSDWDCLSEGPMWGMWWIQNSYGPTYCALPFLQEPWLTFLQHSQDMWFNHQGDGKTKRALDFIGPDGCLCDAASPDTAYHVQGDCRWQIHDWGFEFTAAGVVMQAELLLIGRDREAIRRYLSHLERACDFIETRRDPKNSLFLVGPGANLLAPSYGGIRQPDGSFGKGYLAGLSVTYLAALDRMVELFKLAGEKEKEALYELRRRMTRDSLPQLLTPDGYFVKSIEQDGTRHGVLGQDRYGYFEAVVNHDAIAFRAVDRAQAEKIYAQIASLPELRPHGFIITNYPSLDDTYDFWGTGETGGLWEFGRWVNGGAWATCEARAIMAYSRLGKYEDVRRSARHFMRFADDFQMDAPFTKFGKEVWFNDNPVNLCYDDFGIPAAITRGLFEYIYGADSLTLIPHVPPSIQTYSQKEPVRFGEKRIRISIRNGGPRITSLRVNGRRWNVEAPDRVTLPYKSLPEDAKIALVTEGGWPSAEAPADGVEIKDTGAIKIKTEPSQAFRKPYTVLKAMHSHLRKEPGADFERSFILEALRAIESFRLRVSLDEAGAYAGLNPEKRIAILRYYRNAARHMTNGFESLMQRYGDNPDARKQKAAARYAELQAKTASEPAEWENIRSEGTLNSFAATPEGAVMRIGGSPGASNGWQIPVGSIDTSRYTRLEVRVSGSPNAKVFVDVMEAGGRVLSNTGWQPSSPSDTTLTLSLPPSRKATQIILYTWTEDGKPAENRFRSVRFTGQDGSILEIDLKRIAP